jgi:hypothetical protein
MIYKLISYFYHKLLEEAFMPLPNSPDSNTQKAITIRYNDQTVHLDADNPLNIKLVNNGGANGHNLTAFEKNKV